MLAAEADRQRRGRARGVFAEEDDQFHNPEEAEWPRLPAQVPPPDFQRLVADLVAERAQAPRPGGTRAPPGAYPPGIEAYAQVLRPVGALSLGQVALAAQPGQGPLGPVNPYGPGLHPAAGRPAPGVLRDQAAKAIRFWSLKPSKPVPGLPFLEGMAVVWNDPGAPKVPDSLKDCESVFSYAQCPPRRTAGTYVFIVKL